MLRSVLTNARFLALTLVAVAVVPADVLAQSCAMCATALSDANDPVTRAFNWSIIVLISAPYTLAATAGGWLLYKYWWGQPRRPAPRIFPISPTQKESAQ